MPMSATRIYVTYIGTGGGGAAVQVKNLVIRIKNFPDIPPNLG